MQSSNKYLLALILAVTGSCSNNRGNTETPVNTQRNGKTLTNVAPKYVDDSPSLSSAGTKLVFTSGRTDGVYRTFTMTRTAPGAAFSGVTQLSTTSGLTTEDHALLSPDGNYVLVLGTTTTGRGLVLCNFAGTTCTLISTSPQGERKYSFSPDSALVYYLSAGGTLNVAAVTAPTTASVVGATDHWLHAFWLPVASGYSLVAAENSTTAGKINLVANSFASSTAAATPTVTTLVADLPNKSFVDPGPLVISGSASRFLISRPLNKSSGKMMNELGNIDLANQKKVPILSELHTYSAAGSDEGALSSLDAVGYEILSGYMGADNDTIFTLNRIAGRCEGEGTATYGTSIAITSKTGTSTNLILKKVTDNTDKTRLPAIAAQFCDRTLSSFVASLDLSVRDFVVNPGATASAYSMAWVSDMIEDPEVYVADLVSGQTTITAASANPKP